MTMRPAKQKKLKSRGWKVGTVRDFLGLSPAESAYIELKLSLSESLKRQRQNKQLSQVEFAKRIRSSQSRIAKMEAGDPSVSLDLLIKSLLALGTSRKELAKVIHEHA
jgi:ribosome-binding protein aMBF1 (putative translation factor)